MDEVAITLGTRRLQDSNEIFSQWFTIDGDPFKREFREFVDLHTALTFAMAEEKTLLEQIDQEITAGKTGPLSAQRKEVLDTLLEVCRQRISVYHRCMKQVRRNGWPLPYTPKSGE